MYIKLSFFSSLVVGSSLLLLSGCSAPANTAQNQGEHITVVQNPLNAQRDTFIEQYAVDDPVFAALAAQADPKDPQNIDYWYWRTDQYLYGQYPSYQAIYEAETAGKTFHQIYNMPLEDLGPKPAPIASLPRLPNGYFTENLPGNPHTGWRLISGDTLYITYQGHLTDPYVATYNLTTHQWQGAYKAGESTLSKGMRKIDSHGRPIIEKDSKGHLHIVYGGHGGEREDGLNPNSIDTPHAGGRMFHIMSKRPNDISEFVFVNDISPFASYTKSYTMRNGDIYLFTRLGTHKSPWVYYKMPYGQQSFNEPVRITLPTVQLDNPINVDTFYINPVKISDTEIAISYLWHECNFLEFHDKTHYSRINSYFVRLDTSTDTFFNAQGEQITLPITLAVANDKMLAFDSTDREETPFSTKPLQLDDNTPAVAYQALTPDYREWRMTAFKNGQWEHSLPMPGTAERTLVDLNNNNIENIIALEPIEMANNALQSALVVYKDMIGNDVLAQAVSNNSKDWQVIKIEVSMRKTRIQIDPIKNAEQETIAMVVALKKGKAQRLYLWHAGQFRGNSKNIPIISESFENGGWNASHARGFTPGMNSDLAPNFLFNQHQGEHAFVLENNLVRDGQHAAKLVWHHTNPATYNGNPNKIDNVDRKAMFHGHKTPTVKGAHAWYGFSVYFPKEGTQEEENPWLFFQIHGSADKHLKEHSRNPPFSLTLTENGLTGSWKWDSNELSPTRTGEGTERFNIPGDKDQYVDRWVDFVVHAKVDYSETKTGILELWVDGNKVLNEHNIQFGYNDKNGIYPSWGMYFNGDLSLMQHDHYLYLDAIKTSSDKRAVYTDVTP